MPTPSQPDPDDSWAELYNELGLEPETAAPKAAAAEPAAPDADGPEAAGEYVDEAGLAEGDAGADEEGEGDAEAESESAEGEASEEGGDPTKKKRRRRRRRRGGKKEDGAEAGVAAEAGTDAAKEPEAGDVAVLDDEEDGPSPEASRELLEKWDVPSWGEIVAGLFRPSGNHGR